MKIFNLVAIMMIFGMVSCQSGQNQQQTVSDSGKNLVVENIMSRRSIRSYKPEQVKEDELNTIIQCAINAPSAMNRQSWEVRVVQNPELLKAMSALSERDPFYGAPTVIIVASEVNNTYSPVDCGLLGENILLAAESMNIGTCVIAGPIGAMNSPEAQESIVAKLNLPENYKPLFTIALGYKNESPEARPRDPAKVQIIK